MGSLRQSQNGSELTVPEVCRNQMKTDTENNLAYITYRTDRTILISLRWSEVCCSWWPVLLMLIKSLIFVHCFSLYSKHENLSDKHFHFVEKNWWESSMVIGLTYWSLTSRVELQVNRPAYFMKERNTKPDLVKWEAIILPSHKLCKSTQILTRKAADWYRICSSIFQQYVNTPYLISGWAIYSEIKHSHEVSSISN